jgi:threonyl-tRNA synthetase
MRMQDLRFEIEGGTAQVLLPQGASVRELLAGAAGAAGVEGPIVGIRMGGRVLGVQEPLRESGAVSLVPIESADGLAIMRHSASHVMATAVKRLFPEARLAIGPAIEDGFYYDFDLPRPLQPEDLAAIEKEMSRIIRADERFERVEMASAEAAALFEKRGEPYKVEIISRIAEPAVTLYRNGDFVDLCRGPHLGSSGEVGPVRLLHTAGAYWEGDSRNRMLQRIYGTAWRTVEDLEAYLKRVEEAKQRDHRRLGVQLDLFSMQEEVGGGLVFWHPKGGMLRHLIENFWREEHLKRGYELVYTPHVARADLWHRTGHMDFYRENMYLLQIDEQDYVLKPMNCPGHILIYKSKRRSYRELPIRYAELGTVYRYERSGVLHGMLRVRGFTQDDAHIFCTPDQIVDEIVGCVELARFLAGSFGFKDIQTELSLRDPENREKYAGTDEEWALAESGLREALARVGLPYRVAEGEAVFYGPKIDMKLLDALGRPWQASTVQFDFNVPRRLDVTYIGADGREHPTVMVHRAMLGSLERFVGTLIEHHAGDFPLWIAPVQAVVMTVTDDNVPYARQVVARLKESGIRAELDDRNEKIGAKIRDAELAKTPYMLVVGRREAEAEKASVRSRRRGDEGSQPLREVVDRIVAEARERG